MSPTGVAGEDLSFLEPDPVTRKGMAIRLRQKRGDALGVGREDGRNITMVSFFSPPNGLIPLINGL